MRVILKQTSWLFLAQVLSRLIGFFYTIFLAKSLGVSNFGLYSVTLAYFSLLSSISDFGFNRYLITELAGNNLKIPQLLFSISVFRVTVTSVLFAIFAVVLYLFDPEKMRVSLILLATLSAVPQAAALTLDSVFVALRKLQYSALGLVVLSISTTTLGVAFVFSGFGTIGAIAALIAGQIIYLLILAIFLKGQRFALQIKINWLTIKNIILGSFPYGLVGILGLLYFKIDTLILSYLKGNFDAGIYSAAYKFLEALVFIPSSLSLALFPNVVKWINTNPLRVYKLYIKSTILLFFISLGVVAIYSLFLPQIIIFFLPQYLPSISVIKILSLTIPFMFMISPQSIVLFSDRRFLKVLIVISSFNLLLNIAMNFFLIPKYSYFGSAWATLVSDVIGFVIFFCYIRIKLRRLK